MLATARQPFSRRASLGGDQSRHAAHATSSETASPACALRTPHNSKTPSARDSKENPPPSNRTMHATAATKTTRTTKKAAAAAAAAAATTATITSEGVSGTVSTAAPVDAPADAIVTEDARIDPHHDQGATSHYHAPPPLQEGAAGAVYSVAAPSSSDAAAPVFAAPPSASPLASFVANLIGAPPPGNAHTAPAEAPPVHPSNAPGDSASVQVPNTVAPDTVDLTHGGASIVHAAAPAAVGPSVAAPLVLPAANVPPGLSDIAAMLSQLASGGAPGGPSVPLWLVRQLLGSAAIPFAMGAATSSSVDPPGVCGLSSSIGGV